MEEPKSSEQITEGHRLSLTEIHPMDSTQPDLSNEAHEQEGIWKGIQSLATIVLDKSAEVVHVCQEELSMFATAVAEEAKEVYNENLKEPIDTLRKKLTEKEDDNENKSPLNSKITREFILADEPYPEAWRDFQSSPNYNAHLNEVQKSAILNNDQNLSSIYAELVPSTLSEEAFWVRWRFWNFMDSKKKKITSNEDVKVDRTVSMRDSPAFEAINVSITNMNVPREDDIKVEGNRQHDDPNGEPDWDDWD